MKLLNNKISVVIPVLWYNEDLRKCIKSVLQQNIKPFELIIVIDKANSESSNDYLTKYSEIVSYTRCFDNDIELKFVSTSSNMGPGLARRKGQEECDGKTKYIAFLDSDDCWLENHISNFLSWQRKNKVFDNILYFDMYNAVTMPYGLVTPRKMLFSPRLHTPCAIMSKNQILFNIEKHAEDYAYWSELVLSGVKCYCNNVPGSIGRSNRYTEGQSQQLFEMFTKGAQCILKYYFKSYPVVSLFAILFELIKLPARFLLKWRG